MSFDDATRAQVEAAWPGQSTWLAANAGSGKTRVLTDRVARLLLEGAQPQRILCLTYTKAAAAEMQNRLFQRLGEWAMLPNDALRAQLRDLGQGTHIEDAALAQARTLFARAIETPGGLKIQTIHSFCAAILRRFPLEAGVSPGFAEMEDRAAALMRAQLVQEMAEGPDAAKVEALALHLSDSDFEQVTGDIVGHRSLFQNTRDRATVAAMLDLPQDAQPEDALRIAFNGSERAISDGLCQVFSDQSASYRKTAAAIAALDLENPTLATLDALFGHFLYKSGDQKGKSKSSNYPPSTHTKVVQAMAPIAPEVHGWMDRVAEAYDHLLACALIDKTTALYQFAAAFLPRYAARKEALGWLDFDDLILKARDLLTDRGVAAWVLYRLDGGIDHILVDEAQDTSPDQWRVIELLAQEFTSGLGARQDVARTIFVVGDKKQSIYSFQGADPREFDRMHREFAQKLAEAGKGLVSSELQFSFRSADPILRLVDETFSSRQSSGFPAGNRHRAFKDQMPGRVDLWPVIDPVTQDKDGEWHDPVDRVSQDHHHKQMAHRIATQIKTMLDTATIPREIGNTGQYEMGKVRPGDILILVQRRSALFSEIIRACKELNLPIAGADRLKVGAELAVRDLAALLAFLDLAEDDLSLAVALKSPLFDWSEQSLFTLAHGRGKAHLWKTLRDRAADHPETVAILNDLRRQTDFLRPYDLIERILTRHDGRRRLLARLGPEAEDGINAFLAQALAYERNEVPSLSGFLQWLETDDLEIKRQMDNAGDRIRVMTVHGAKGLEAPIVILPDTAQPNEDLRSLFLSHEGKVIWKTAKPEMPRVSQTIHAALQDAQRQERDRLLYVAMTRAEKWLIVGAAGKLGDNGQSWYEKIAAGMEHCAQVDHDFGFGMGKRLQSGGWDAPATAPDKAAQAALPDLPPVFSTPAPPPRPAPRVISPSDLGGAKALPGDAGQDEETAKRYGRAVHLLLEHLPGHPQEGWRDLARHMLMHGADRVDDTEFRAVFDEAAAILAEPGLAHIFAPDTLAEVPLVAPLDAMRQLNGIADRLILTDDAVQVVDFKSNATIPDSPDQTPEGVLRQLGAYVAALRQIYPEHRVECAILWTRHALLMPVPVALADAALDRFLATAPAETPG